MVRSEPISHPPDQTRICPMSRRCDTGNGRSYLVGGMGPACRPLPGTAAGPHLPATLPASETNARRLGFGDGCKSLAALIKMAHHYTATHFPHEQQGPVSGGTHLLTGPALLPRLEAGRMTSRNLLAARVR